MNERYSVARGMRDMLAVDATRMSFVEQAFITTLRQYGYEEIRLPLLEKTELFQRGVGEATDVVSKEMYIMEDRGGDSLALRPEGTASCVRAAINNSMLRGNNPRLWYVGPMYRYERPQKGRYREFTQVGAEAFGYTGPDVDTELIEVGTVVWEQLGIAEHVTLELNTLGSPASRMRFREALIDYLTPQREFLDPDSLNRLSTNPLRILDSKNERTQQIVSQGPNISDYLDSESVEFFVDLQSQLDARGIAYQCNDRLVRGLDYYTHTVFEWNTDKLGAQKQLGGGGRYDGLFEILGGEPTHAAGFAVGVDRIALLHENCEASVESDAADIYVVTPIGVFDTRLDAIMKGLRARTTLRVKRHMGGGRLKVQLRQADRSGARWALIAGDQELQKNVVGVKWLREARDQVDVSIDALAEFFEQQHD